MTQDRPVDPNVVAEVAPGEGDTPGSIEYGGSEIHQDGAGGGSGTGGAGSGGTGTTEAGTFVDLPPGEEDRGD